MGSNLREIVRPRLRLLVAVGILLVLAAGCAPRMPDAGRGLADRELRAGRPVLERPAGQWLAEPKDWPAAYDAARSAWKRGPRPEMRDRVLDCLPRFSEAELEQLLLREMEPVFRCRALELLTDRLADDPGRRERLREVLTERLAYCPLDDARRAELEARRGPETDVAVLPGARLRVGCLLPLTGDYAAYGRRVLQGMMLALPVFSSAGKAGEGATAAGGRPEAMLEVLPANSAAASPSSAAAPPASPMSVAASPVFSSSAAASPAFLTSGAIPPDTRRVSGGLPPLELVIRDTAGNGERARELARELIEDEGVALLVGPVTGPAALQAAIEAEVHRVPVIALSPQPGLAARGEYVFQHFLTARNEARELASAAVGRLGLENLALLYPRTSFGDEFAEHFRATVDDWGGRVVRSVPYAPDTSDFGPQIRELIGNERYAAFTRERREYEEWKREQERLARQYAADNQGKLRSLAEELGLETGELFAAEQPPAADRERRSHPILALDFTGLVVPDFQSRLRLIIPQLIFYDLAEVRFLGGRSWASGDLQEDAGDYLPGAVFVGSAIDLLPAGSAGDTPAAAYCRAYAAQYDEPASSYDAYGYDTVILVARLREALRLGADGAEGEGFGEEVAAALRGVRDMLLVTGVTTALPDGELAKELPLLTRNAAGGIVPVETICTGGTGD